MGGESAGVPRVGDLPPGGPRAGPREVRPVDLLAVSVAGPDQEDGPRGDLRDPLLRKLADNDCYDWTPTIPMVLFCLEDDFLVVKENTLNAIAAMRARGVSQDVVRHYMITGRKFDHMKGILPGLMLARKFFDSGMTAVPIND